MSRRKPTSNLEKAGQKSSIRGVTHGDKADTGASQDDVSLLDHSKRHDGVLCEFPTPHKESDEGGDTHNDENNGTWLTPTFGVASSSNGQG